jgi:hypothetical protein
MVRLFGERLVYMTSGDRLERKLVATFDDEESANEYIKDSSLKIPVSHGIYSERRFRKNSVLGEYTWASIELDFHVPHNPES